MAGSGDGLPAALNLVLLLIFFLERSDDPCRACRWNYSAAVIGARCWGAFVGWSFLSLLSFNLRDNCSFRLLQVIYLSPEVGTALRGLQSIRYAE